MNYKKLKTNGAEEYPPDKRRSKLLSATSEGFTYSEDLD